MKLKIRYLLPLIILLLSASLIQAQEPVSAVDSLYVAFWPDYDDPSVLVLMTGDRESETATRMAENWPLYQPIEHVSFFSARSLIRLIESAGFAVVRKEWRFMYMPWGMGSRTFRFTQKLKEIVRLVETPGHDHFYLYARKP